MRQAVSTAARHGIRVLHDKFALEAVGKYLCNAHVTNAADKVVRILDMDGLQPGTAADRLPGLRARPLKEDRHGASGTKLIELCLLFGE